MSCCCVTRYYTTEFDWNQNVVTIKEHKSLSKFDKWWMSKSMCIEGTTLQNPIYMYVGVQVYRMKFTICKKAYFLYNI